ncbi:hypothetical protein EDC96DRAFT_569690 [Choanephora cucurbitarum]|nr:hypothetical protein EDC96DRAFT_569690 [Choanephora cucurbitarum]
MSHFSDKIDSLLRGTRKTEDEASEIKMHVEQLEARFEERINQLFTMVERNNEILKKLVVVEDKERSEFVGNQLEVTVLPACLISRLHIKDMHGDSNTPLNRFKYFLISCFGDSINPDLSKVVLADLLYQVHEKEPELKVKTWTQIPLKYKLAAYDDLRYLGNVYRIPINRSRVNWLKDDLISYYFRNKKPDQLVNSHLTSSVYSNANLLVFQSSKSKTAEGSNPAKGRQPVEGLRAVVLGGNIPPHLATVDLDDSELDPDLAATIFNSAVMQQGDKRPFDYAESEGSNKMRRQLIQTVIHNLKLELSTFIFLLANMVLQYTLFRSTPVRLMLTSILNLMVVAGNRTKPRHWIQISKKVNLLIFTHGAEYQRRPNIENILLRASVINCYLRRVVIRTDISYICDQLK